MWLLPNISEIKRHHYVTISLLLTISIVSVMSILFHGRITFDYLVTGAVASVLVSFFVISANVLYQKTIEEQNLKLSEEEKRLSEILNEKNEVLSIVAHDIRNHLNAITINCSYLELESKADEVLNREEILEASTDILESVSRIDKIAESLIKANRLESGSVDLSSHSFDLGLIIPSLADRFSNASSRKDILIHWAASDGMLIHANEDATLEVLENLVSNAIKFSPREKNIWIRSNDTATAVQIEVQDEGPGLTPEDQTKLFEKYAKLSPNPTGGEESIGLGLSIAKKLVELMNGRIWCESTAGQGASFFMELPKNKTEHREPQGD